MLVEVARNSSLNEPSSISHEQNSHLFHYMPEHSSEDFSNMEAMLASNDEHERNRYLMTKTAMQLHGRGDLSGASNTGAGSMGLGGAMSIHGSIGPLQGSMNREIKPHQCQQCLKAFSSNHQLVQHIRVHTGEKPYKCSYCERRFKQLSHVQQHTRLHTGERPYKCHVMDCGRAFIQLSNLQQHLRNHESQLERLKNRPFHCSICGKGFATESSLRTHNGKGMCFSNQQTSTIIGGSNASCCPLCQKICLSGESLMEHMKFVHKDPNASGVPAKRRSANHPCPVCGKYYVNEGSLRKHLSSHPEMAGQLASTLRMWPCNVCTAVFTHEQGLMSHMEQMRMDPKHQFAAQYVLSQQRREREAIIAAAAMNMSHFAMGQPMLSGGSGSVANCPSQLDMGSTRISTPAEMKMEHGNVGTNSMRNPLEVAAAAVHAAAVAADYSTGFSNLSRNHNIIPGGSSNTHEIFRAGTPHHASSSIRVGASPAVMDANEISMMGSSSGVDGHGSYLHHHQQHMMSHIPSSTENHNGNQHRSESVHESSEQASMDIAGSSNGIRMSGDPHSPATISALRSMDANSAAYLALRNNPETTIRPINCSTTEAVASNLPVSDSLYMRQGQLLIGNNDGRRIHHQQTHAQMIIKPSSVSGNGHSVNEETSCPSPTRSNEYKDVIGSFSGNSLSNGSVTSSNSNVHNFTTSCSGGSAGHIGHQAHAYSNDFLNRFRLEQTIKQLHGFQDTSNLNIPFAAATAAAASSSHQDQY